MVTRVRFPYEVPASLARRQSNCFTRSGVRVRLLREVPQGEVLRKHTAFGARETVFNSLYLDHTSLVNVVGHADLISRSTRFESLTMYHGGLGYQGNHLPCKQDCGVRVSDSPPHSIRSKVGYAVVTRRIRVRILDGVPAGLGQWQTVTLPTSKRVSDSRILHQLL